MLRFSVLFTLGVLAFHQLARLPDWPWLAVAGVLAAVFGLSRRLRPVLALLAGFAWSNTYALITVPPDLLDGGKVLRLELSGRVASLPDRSHDMVRFIFEADTVEGLGDPLHGSWRVRLSWRDPPDIGVGEVWRLPVRLRAVHGYASPGAWDYEGWLYWQGVRYRGYVLAEGGPRRLPGKPCCRLTQLRAMVSAAIDSVNASDYARGVMRAITVGDQSGLSSDAKALFRATGTSHLMAISGLHIGLLAGLGLFSVSWTWRRIPALCARVPARLAGAVAGLMVATLYAALAGMGLPTQRALIMLVVFALAVVLRREHNTMQALATASVCVLLWHPPSVVSAGFWLSFGAVAAILAAIPWTRGSAVWYRAAQVQLAITLALWPILMAFGMPASGAAPLVNLILVPVFGLVLVPMTLLSVLLLLSVPAAGDWMLRQLGELLDLVRWGLEMVARLPLPDLAPTGLGTPELVLLVLAVGLILSPPGFPLRWLALPMLGLLWLPRAAHLSPGEFEVHLLDIGQGLGTVVETRRHTLVFDTGPEYPSGFSAAAAVIQPFLAKRGRRRIDRLILSHGDKDHAGGVAHLLSGLAVEKVQSGEPERVGHGAERCVAGERWRWDGVDFEFLHPRAEAELSGNDASCVLRISNNAGSVLFTGDIGKGVERLLVRRMPEKLASRAVVAPHHGSLSSSGAKFVAATAPDYVLYSTGWANRYGFPAPRVAARWLAAGAQALDTAPMGTIGLRFSSDGSISGPTAHRLGNKRFWWHDSGLAEPMHAVSFGD